MKNSVILFIILFQFQIIFSQDVKTDMYKIFRIENLYGEWTFIELQDTNGNKVTGIPIPYLEGIHKKGKVEKVNRPDLVLKANGEYEKHFDSAHVDIGKWKLERDLFQISYSLRVSKDNPGFKYLKEAKMLFIDDDGFYYQKPIKELIIYIDASEDSLRIEDSRNYFQVYKRL